MSQDYTTPILHFTHQLPIQFNNQFTNMILTFKYSLLFDIVAVPSQNHHFPPLILASSLPPFYLSQR